MKVDKRCLLVNDFCQKIEEHGESYSFGQWLSSLGAVDLWLLERVFYELTAPLYPLNKPLGSLEYFGEGSRTAALILVLGVALERKETQELWQIQKHCVPAAFTAELFVSISYLAQTGVDFKVNFQNLLLTRSLKGVDLVSKGAKFEDQLLASSKESPVPSMFKSKDYSEEERGVQDEAFQALLKKVLDPRKN